MGFRVFENKPSGWFRLFARGERIEMEVPMIPTANEATGTISTGGGGITSAQAVREIVAEVKRAFSAAPAGSKREDDLLSLLNRVEEVQGRVRTPEPAYNDFVVTGGLSVGETLNLDASGFIASTKPTEPAIAADDATVLRAAVRFALRPYERRRKEAADTTEIAYHEGVLAFADDVLAHLDLLEGTTPGRVRLPTIPTPVKAVPTPALPDGVTVTRRGDTVELRLAPDVVSVTICGRTIVGSVNTGGGFGPFDRKVTFALDTPL